MSKTNTVQPTTQVDYLSWLKHELLTLAEISLLARGAEPTPINQSTYNVTCIFRTCKISSTLSSACKAGQIKTYANNNASPIECFLYLRHMDIPLPTELLYVLENNLEEIQKYLKTKIKRKRTTESYQRTDVRGDDTALRAVLKTLLDLYPGLPKDDLIDLKPVQVYANGHKHHPKKLKKMISEIEGQNRAAGNRNREQTESIKRSIPQSWIKFKIDSNHI